MVLVSGPGAWSSLLPRDASDGCVPHRLGCGHEWPPCPRFMEAYKLPGDAGHTSSIKTLSPRPKKSPCVGAHRQHNGGLLYQPPRGLFSRRLYKLAYQILVWSQGKLLLLRAVHIPGHLNMGADILLRQGPRPGE